MIEAELHCVWQDNKGQLVDITPKVDNEETALFVTNPNEKYCGITRDNIRVNITENKLVDDLILYY